MPSANLIYAYSCDEPEKQFVICDLSQGRPFVDPLTLFSLPFYDIDGVNEKGLIALGGEIDTPTLLKSYKWGIFPWYAYKLGEPVHWYCPQNRFVIFPESVHIGHSLRNSLNKGKYSITINKAFPEVIHHCKTVNNRDKDTYSWLSEKLENVFIELHEMGFAKSIEVREDGELIGGFYGFFYNGVFQGESMFSLKSSASQIGLILLCRNPYIDGIKIKLIDTQFETPTFKKLGGEYIPYSEYRRIMSL